MPAREVLAGPASRYAAAIGYVPCHRAPLRSSTTITRIAAVDGRPLSDSAVIVVTCLVTG
ncbi:hypothetical protein ACRCUN_18420 [Mycobacterium sp. LTG2003]